MGIWSFPKRSQCVTVRPQLDAPGSRGARVRDSATRPAYVAEVAETGEEAVRVDVPGTWRKVLRVCNEYVEIIGRKEVAFDVGLSAAGLKHALAERERHHLPARVLVYLLVNSPDDRLARLLAAVGGGTWEKRRKRTQAEIDARMRERALERGGELAEQWLDWAENG